MSSIYLERAAELIEQALKSELEDRLTPAFRAEAQRKAAEQYARLAQIERGYDFEALRALITELTNTAD